MTYVESKIDFTKIITLPQMRTQFEPHAIQELADAITQAKGILNPPIVVPFSQKGFTEYVGFVCTVYKQKLSKAEMNSFYKKAVGQKFATMVAGKGVYVLVTYYGMRGVLSVRRKMMVIKLQVGSVGINILVRILRRLLFVLRIPKTPKL
jgi:hypothetical protein